MTIAGYGMEEEGRGPGLARWGGGLLLALGAHAGLAVGVMAWHTPVEPDAAPPAAVMIDLAPLPVAPPPAEAPPQPEPPQEMTEPPPPEPPPPEPEPPEPEPIVEPPPPEPPPVVEPEVVLPKPEPKPEPPKPEPKPQPTPKPKVQPKPVPKVERAEPHPAVPAAVPAAPAAPAAAPAPAPAPSYSRAVPTWQGSLLAHLERHKRYPRSAQSRRQQGVAQVRFTIDQDGNVLSVRLDRSSGHEVLDEETVEMVKRASPLPAPPPEMAQSRIELVVPVQFFIK